MEKTTMAVTSMALSLAAKINGGEDAEWYKTHKNSW